ncbi:MAG: transaldolase [Nanoarchaeota archaeon]|nr:transaldolase [Nanoarchaeota archaeon]
MKLFLDSAIYEEAEELYHAGVCDGITMNPSLVKKVVEQKKKIKMLDYMKKLLKLARGTPVSMEVIETDYPSMVDQGKKIYKMFNPVAKNVYIKIPVNPVFEKSKGQEFDGIKAIKTLTKANIPVNCTLIFTPEQALLAAKAGAAFVSPFAGRIDDYIRKNHNIDFEKTDYFPALGWFENGQALEDNGVISGIDLVKQIVEIFRKHNIHSEVLAASIRNARQAREAALVGADIATVPYKIFKELLTHYKTQEGMAKFTADAPKEYIKLLK